MINTIRDVLGVLALFAMLIAGSALGYGLDEAVTPAGWVEVAE